MMKDLIMAIRELTKAVRECLGVLRELRDEVKRQQ